MTNVIELKKINKSYIGEKKSVQVLKNIDADFEAGKMYAIMGHSGSGKSTLINILGMMDIPTDGNYYLMNKDVSKMKDSELSKLRMKCIGFIFQDFYLNSTLKAYENVIIPMLINSEIKSTERVSKAKELIKQVGLEDRQDHFPKELSGGEQQRVAIARALANDPDIILADEPTGNLDEETEKNIFSLLKELSKKGKCVIVVSHSNEVKKYADELLEIKDGKVSIYEND